MTRGPSDAVVYKYKDHHDKGKTISPCNIYSQLSFKFKILFHTLPMIEFEIEFAYVSDMYVTRRIAPLPYFMIIVYKVIA